MKNKLKRGLVGATLTLLMACASNSVQENKKEISTKNYLLQENYITNSVAANHQKIIDVKGDFSSFKALLAIFENDSLTSVAYALDYIKTCIPNNNKDRDSIFFLFSQKLYNTANQLSASLETEYAPLVGQLYVDSTSAELTAFKNNLAACGLDLFSTEGMYYVDIASDYLYSNFENRVSDGVAEFLSIRKDELKQGFSEDAGLLISFPDVYKRVKRWEKYLNKFPNTINSEEANSYYVTYLQTLMTGMDNSNIFDYESQALLPEIKTVYETIISEEPESPTTKTINSYYSFLARHDFKENDSSQLFLQANHLSSMQAVQPDTR